VLVVRELLRRAGWASRCRQQGCTVRAKLERGCNRTATRECSCFPAQRSERLWRTCGILYQPVDAKIRVLEGNQETTISIADFPKDGMFAPDPLPSGVDSARPTPTSHSTCTSAGDPDRLHHAPFPSEESPSLHTNREVEIESAPLVALTHNQNPLWVRSCRDRAANSFGARPHTLV
jgi:hypothetical protein